MTTQSLRTILMIVALAVFAVGTGCSGAKAVPDFRVSEITPADGDQGVAIDKTIYISFSTALDADSVNDETVSVSCDGRPAAGRILAHEKVVMFVPAQLAPNADCAVRVDAAVTDTKGRSLGQDVDAAFRTGETTADGRPYVDADAGAPFRGRRYIHLTRQVEFVLFGAKLDASANNVHILDPVDFNQGDAPNELEIIHASANNAYAPGAHKIGAAGNLDDDAFDEVVTLVNPPTGPAVMRVMDHTGVALASPEAPLVIDGELGSAYRYSLSLLDLDGDGYDEILVSGTNGLGGARLWIYDDAKAEHKLLAVKDILGKVDGAAWSGVQLLRVAAGNIDQDPEPEIVLAMQTGAGAGSAIMLVTIDDLDTEYAELDRTVTSVVQTDAAAPDFALALADLDGDRIAEVVVARRQQQDTADGGCAQALSAAVYARNGAAYTEWTSYSTAASYASSCDVDQRRDLALHAIDINGDRAYELVLEAAILRWDDEDDALSQATDEQGVACRVPLFAGGGTVETVAVGDVNGDARADVILLHSDASIQTWGLESEHVGYNLDDTPRYESRWQQIDERGGYDTPEPQHGLMLVPANTDGDSLIVTPSPATLGSEGTDDPGAAADSTVEHRIVFTKNRILNVLAAAPCYAEDWQEDCSTTLSTSVGGSITAGASFSVWTGVAVGFSQEVSAGLFVSANTLEVEAMVKTEIEASVWASATVGAEYTKSVTAGKGEDLVTFFTIPHHQYVYTFASHPDSGAKGSNMTINVPMSPRIFTVTVDYYNANNGTDADIDESVLPHTAGEPDTYLSSSEAMSHLVGRLPLGTPTTPNQVGQGAAIEDSLTLSAEATVGGEVKLSIEAEAKVCVAGVCVAGNQGVSFAAFAEVTLSSSTSFSGEVGGIDADHYADHLYTWGMFSYVDTMKDASGRLNQLFTVVNYYVE